MVEDDFVATFLINMAQFTEFEAFLVSEFPLYD